MGAGDRHAQREVPRRRGADGRGQGGRAGIPLLPGRALAQELEHCQSQRRGPLADFQAPATDKVNKHKVYTMLGEGGYKLEGHNLGSLWATSPEREP